MRGRLGSIFVSGHVWPADGRPEAATRTRRVWVQSSQAAKAVRDAFDFLAREFLTSTDLVDDLGGGLGHERTVVKLGRGRREFLLCGGQTLFEPAPFGLDVDAG